ncbi:GGDEF domain-containing protein [Yersinia similis]|uniref:diguanylate cyclase n=2 Tax=Yersinia similis TaxID=367190 RepID=A0ABN4CM44_9GAMM|nr:GGDEF domain-containing protein [Yersinia similis]AHK19789.1 diguanylate cyclase [Yersinia similis]
MQSELNMNSHSYDQLLKSKHRLSLLLFLFLNASSAIFSMLSSSPKTPPVTFPVVMIAVINLSAAAYLIFISKNYIDKKSYVDKNDYANKLNLFSIIIGVLWAWQIILKYEYLETNEDNYLLLSLFTIFFISTIALSDNFFAFCLHTAPSAITVILLDDFHNIFRIIFTIMLPLIGFSLHHLMLRRTDNFTRKLVDHLSNEREKFSDLSMIDPLTSLYNRRGLESKLETLLSQSPGNHYVLLLDIDHFKAYNDNYGHTMGDQALVRVSAAIRDAVRSRDIVVRYGGEEFLVLLTHVSEEYASQLAERVRQRVLGLDIPHVFNHKVSTTVTLSAGISPLQAYDLAASLKAADEALYRAKKNGRNSIEFAKDELSNVQSSP